MTPSVVESTPGRREHDPVQRWLVTVLFCVLAVFAATAAAIVLYVQSSGGVPRTALERQIMTDETAAREKPQVIENWARLALSYAHAERWDDAQDALDHGYAIRKAAILDLTRADILRMKGDRGAVAAYDDAIRSATAEYDRAAKRLLEEKEVYRPAPNTMLIEAMKGRALALDQLGRTKEAAGQAIKAIELDPGDADFRVKFADMLAKLGQKADAEAHYRTALTYVPDHKGALAGLKKLGKDR